MVRTYHESSAKKIYHIKEMTDRRLRPAMNILMLAPEPFFQPRGTPISVYFRATALTDTRA